MQKKIYLCDFCGETVAKEKLNEKSLDFYRYEVCQMCSKKLDNAKEELNQCRAEHEKKIKEIYEKYGIKR